MTKSNLNMSGIYQIMCLPNLKVYIGSAVNIRMRWKLHRTHLRMGISHNKPLQKAWNKYGESAFTYHVLEFCDPEKLAEVEQHWLDSKRAYVRGVGFNVLATAYSSIGLKHSDETRKKLSELASSRDHSHLRRANEARRGLPAHNRGVKGKKWTDEQKALMSAQRKGREPWNKGIPHTDEAKRKISAGGIGLNRTFTNEQREHVKKLRSDGLSYSKIACATGISLSSCHKIAHDNTGKYIPLSLRTVEKVKGVA